MKFTKPILVNIILRLSLVILVATFISIYYAYITNKKWSEKNLIDYAVARQHLDDILFQTVKENHTLLINKFKEQYTQQKKYTNNLKLNKDGSYRTLDKDFDENNHAGIFFSNLNKLQNEDIKILSIAKDISEQYGKAYINQFPNTYFSFPTNALVLFAPGFSTGWIFKTAANYDFKNDSWFTVANPENNPEKTTRWTKPYFDHEAKKWMVTASTPIWIETKYIGAVHHDVYIDKIIERTIQEKLPDSTNYIISKDGFIIANEKYQKIIEDSKENINAGSIEDENLNSQFKYIKNHPEENHQIFETTDSINTFSELKNDDWYFVSTIPKSKLIKQAIKSSWIILALSLSSLFFEILLLIFIFHFKLEKPLKNMLAAIKNNNEGKFNLIKIDETNHDDELADITITFNQLITTLHQKDQFLENYNEHLSEEMSRARQELTQSHEIMIQQSRLTALGELAGGIAHEVNTPLAVIKLYSSLIKKEANDLIPDTDKIAQYAEKTDLTIDKIAKIIRGLKFFAQDDSTQPSEIFTADKILEATLELCSEKIKNHSISLTAVEIDNFFPLNIKKMQAVQILLNYLTLLIKIFDQVKIEDKSISISMKILNSQLLIEVTDNCTDCPVNIKELISNKTVENNYSKNYYGYDLNISNIIAQKNNWNLDYTTYENINIFNLTIKINLEDS